MIKLAGAAATQPRLFTEIMEHVAEGFEILGAALLVAGIIWSFMVAGRAWHRSGQVARGYTVLRRAFGGTLLLGLEVLVAADLIRTVAIAPTIANLAGLGLIVLIRTFLSFSLETEIQGVPPWRRALTTGAGAVRRAAVSARQQDTE
jgi:uncharacterized membrane protein